LFDKKISFDYLKNMINSTTLTQAKYNSGNTGTEAVKDVIYKGADRFFQKKIYNLHGTLKYFI